MSAVTILIALAVATVLLLTGLLDFARHRSDGRVWIAAAFVIVASVAVSMAAT